MGSFGTTRPGLPADGPRIAGSMKVRIVQSVALSVIVSQIVSVGDSVEHTDKDKLLWAFVSRQNTEDWSYIPTVFDNYSVSD